MLFRQLTTLNTGQKAVIIVIAGDTMETGKAIAVVGLRTAIAIHIHPPDKELRHWFLDNTAPIRRMSMGKATGIDTCLAEELVALEAEEVPHIEAHLLGADAATSFGGVGCVLQPAEHEIVLDTPILDSAFANEVEHGITNAHPHLLMLVEVG